LAVLKIKLRDLCMLSVKHSTTELHSQPLNFLKRNSTIEFVFWLNLGGFLELS
jgi:hypothetical protein